ncbi:putative cupin superfamily protein [Catenulispora sp. GAS73]|uniref:hypothetical protein n=1 Tax=Catenulispora sp. GAS73 TaxID=3156269 RepID=UPI0035143449
MDERPDPIQIVARPSSAIAQDQKQAFGIWIPLAGKADWQVDALDEAVAWSAGECGVVDVEGLRYLIRAGLRSRSKAVIVPGDHVGVHVSDLVTGRRSFPAKPVFASTVWAEPLLP